ncbi:mercuric reductase [Algoriphagus halophilus]|uniref:Pyruvate/2-oxoglutarate dehydrogenase complex, dihydrolipoamide dehydrogenase (E3) component n=1 Tax=Algoriphagus halophilus TaxID=226505 RepID=A0A1N6FJV7_9BACT|nr:mercuric reductase [Algoriphagus halophilus]SIN95547.1 Pyruvate/2-oxoglutarate dehydrogenase complex, dihydrolipoamide dehydrogenase (E3) component [Algoriphagus halophilus]
MKDAKKQTFDAIIIGSGQAGNPLAFALAEQNLNVALVEKGKFGGTCVNTGCTPTKAYVASARRAWEIKNASDLGIPNPKLDKIDLQKVKERKDKIVAVSHNGLVQGIRKEKWINTFQAKGYFLDPTTIQAGSAILTAPKIFINVGTRPRIPDGFEDVNYLTNESLLELEELPDHLVIIGGSYIGLEFAQIFRRLGSKVTIIEMSDRLISKEDPDISDRMRKILESEGINVLCNSHCLEGKNNPNGGLTVLMNCGGEKKQALGSHLLLATGRKSNIDLINPLAAGLEVDEKGFMQVNDLLETSVKGIYALGDCNGKGVFTHTSYHDFEVLKNQLFGNKARKVSDRILNYALYTDPPLGRAGMNISQAKKSNKKILYAEMEMSQINRAREKDETKGKMEVIVDASTEQILGATVLGIGGDEIIGVFLTAMYSKMSYKTLMNSVQTHPTVTELIPTLLQQVKPLKSES